MNDQQLDALLEGDAQGSAWRPTPEFFDTLQREMTEVDVRLATEKPRSWIPVAAAAAIGALALGASYAFFVNEGPDTATGPELTQRSTRDETRNTRIDEADKPPATDTGQAPVPAAAPAVASGASQPVASSPAVAPASAAIQPQKPLTTQTPLSKTSSLSKSKAAPHSPPRVAGGEKKSASAEMKPRARKKAPAAAAKPKPSPLPRRPMASRKGDALPATAKPAASPSLKAKTASSSRVKQSLSRKRAALRACLKGLKPLPASVTLKARILSGPDGRVRRVVVETALPDPVTSCVVNVLKRSSVGPGASVPFSMAIRLR